VIAIAADQNFNEQIVDGLLRRSAEVNVVLIREVGLEAALDPDVLAWAAQEGRVLVTHDRRTVPAFAAARVRAGAAMAGVFLVDSEMPVGQAIDELLIAVHCLSPDECRNMIRYFPM
jgi:hypothetical protein